MTTHKNHKIKITHFQEQEDGPWFIAHSSFEWPYKDRVLYSEDAYDSPESAIRMLPLIWDSMDAQEDLVRDEEGVPLPSGLTEEIEIEWWILCIGQVNILPAVEL